MTPPAAVTPPRLPPGWRWERRSDDMWTMIGPCGEPDGGASRCGLPGTRTDPPEYGDGFDVYPTMQAAMEAAAQRTWAAWMAEQPSRQRLPLSPEEQRRRRPLPPEVLAAPEEEVTPPPMGRGRPVRTHRSRPKLPTILDADPRDRVSVALVVAVLAVAASVALRAAAW